MHDTCFEESARSVDWSRQANSPEKFPPHIGLIFGGSVDKAKAIRAALANAAVSGPRASPIEGGDGPGSWRSPRLRAPPPAPWPGMRERIRSSCGSRDSWPPSLPRSGVHCVARRCPATAHRASADRLQHPSEGPAPLRRVAATPACQWRHRCTGAQRTGCLNRVRQGLSVHELQSEKLRKGKPVIG